LWCEEFLMIFFLYTKKEKSVIQSAEVSPPPQFIFHFLDGDKSPM